MILIADSGSTKTDWRILRPDGGISQVRTVGFNPFYQTTEEIIESLRSTLKPSINEQITSIFFYGTGINSPEKASIVSDALGVVFPEAQSVEVHSDMLGAARALCGRNHGIACILGTGANTCIIDGGEILEKAQSLGFWLGDEGSGGYLGKTLIQAFLQGELPNELHTKLQKRFPELTHALVMENAYKKPFPNRYFAGFSKFLFDNRQHPVAYQIIQESFGLFFQRYVCKYPNHKELAVHFTGSVAFYYSDILRRVAAELGITVGIIMETPIAGLALFHRE